MTLFSSVATPVQPAPRPGLCGLSLLTVLMLAGCGQKGALVLPESTTAAAAAVQPAASAASARSTRP